MSYDVSFRVKVEGIDEYVDVGSCDANITWNVRQLIKESSGWDILNEDYNGLVKDLIPKLQAGLNNLLLNPQKYIEFESPNGWGTVSGVINFYKNIINSWIEFVGDYPKLVDVAVIYVC